jgi:hypothetical protein
MKDRIGEIAGKIWTILGEKQDLDILKLPKILKEKGEIVYQALGWLAREDKINYHTKEKKTFVSLTHGEREIFKNASGTLSEQASQKDSQVLAGKVEL